MFSSGFKEVRIAASWALANLCDSLRHCIDRFTLARSSVDLMDCSKMVSLLIDCSLRFTRDGDKIKSKCCESTWEFIKICSMFKPRC
ncbi:hypothetical protein L1987_11758 [Smallanthus sonchifolius]|uniref:Uncharacterized protein n=1 Tax=Smallanthus sonchifolius TaxID=185202 RepID=A0ACB9JCQ8_9ASTR|nr:hypothetical protein L1987_11758 [Smallanthus sonchifolius]